MKKIAMVAAIILAVNFNSQAQFISWYTSNPQHPAYQLAQSWAGWEGDDYIRGFCFGWDALGGHSVSYGYRTIEMGGPNSTYYMYLGDGISSFLYSQFLSAEYFYTAAYLLETTYVPTITDPSELAFYHGYVNLLYQVSYSPGILEISSGNQN